MSGGFRGAQRVHAVFGEWTVRVDVATQDQADLIGDQTPQPDGPPPGSGMATPPRRPVAVLRLHPVWVTRSRATAEPAKTWARRGPRLAHHTATRPNGRSA